MPQTLLKLLPDGSGNEQVAVSIRSLKDSSAAFVSTPTVTIDWTATDYKKLTLLSDTVVTFSGATKDGQQLVLALTQDGSGNHLVTFSNVRLGSDIWSFPVLSIGAGKTDRLMFFYDLSSDTYDLMGYARGF